MFYRILQLLERKHDGLKALDLDSALVLVVCLVPATIILVKSLGHLHLCCRYARQ